MSTDFLDSEFNARSLARSNDNVNTLSKKSFIQDVSLGQKMAFNNDALVNIYNSVKLGLGDSPKAAPESVEDVNKRLGLDLDPNDTSEDKLANATYMATKDYLYSKQVPAGDEFTFGKLIGGFGTPEGAVDIPLTFVAGSVGAWNAARRTGQVLTTAQRLKKLKEQGGTLQNFFKSNVDLFAYNFGVTTSLNIARNYALHDRGVDVSSSQALLNYLTELTASQTFGQIGVGMGLHSRKKQAFQLEMQVKVEDFMTQRNVSKPFFLLTALDKNMIKNHEVNTHLANFLNQDSVQTHLNNVKKAKGNEESLVFDGNIPTKVLKEMDRVLNERTLMILDGRLRNSLFTGLVNSMLADEGSVQLKEAYRQFTVDYLTITEAIRTDTVGKLPQRLQSVVEDIGYKISKEELDEANVEPSRRGASWSNKGYKSNYLRNHMSRAAEARSILGQVSFFRKRYNQALRDGTDSAKIQRYKEEFETAVKAFEDNYAKQFNKEIKEAEAIVREIFGYKNFNVKAVVPPRIDGVEPMGYTIKGNTDDIFISRADFWYSRAVEGYTPFQVILHETVHNMRKLDPRSWKRLVDIVITNPRLKAEFDKILERNNYPQWKFRDEYPSWLVEWALTQKEFMREFRRLDPTFYNKWVDALLRIFRAAKELVAPEFKNITADKFNNNNPDAVARNVAKILKDFKDVEPSFTKVKKFLDSNDVELKRSKDRVNEAQAAASKDREAKRTPRGLADDVREQFEQMVKLVNQQKEFMKDPIAFHEKQLKEIFNLGNLDRTNAIVEDLLDFTQPIRQDTYDRLQKIGISKNLIDNWFNQSKARYNSIATVINLITDYRVGGPDDRISLDKFFKFLNQRQDAVKPPEFAKATLVKIKELEKKDNYINVNRKEGDNHFGNPWTAYKGQTRNAELVTTDLDGKKLTVAEAKRQAVENYRAWLEGTQFKNFRQEQRAWILNEIETGRLSGKRLLHHEPLKGSHAEVLIELAKKQAGETATALRSFEGVINDGLLRKIAYIIQDESNVLNTDVANKVKRLLRQQAMTDLLVNIREQRNISGIRKLLQSVDNPDHRFNLLKSLIDGEQRNTGSDSRVYRSIGTKLRAQIHADQLPLLHILHENGYADIFLADNYQSWLQTVKDIFNPKGKNDRLLENHKAYSGTVEEIAFEFISDLMEGIRTNKVPKRLEGNKDAIKLMQVMRGVTQSQLARLNQLGYAIPTRRDFSGWSQRWSPTVAREMGFERFREEILRIIDFDETRRLHGGFLKPKDKKGYRKFDTETFIKEWFEDLTSPRKEGDERGSYLLSGLINPRVIKVKPEFEAYALKTFSGESNLGKLFLDQVRIRSERIALAEYVSANPLNALKGLAEEFRPKEGDNIAKKLSYETYIASVRQLTGDLDNPVDAALYQASRPFEALSDLVFLPTSGFATISDLANITAQLKYNGVEIGTFSKEMFDVYVTAISERFNGDRSKMTAYFEAQAAGFDAALKVASTRITNDASAGGFMHGLKDIMFSVNGVNHATAAHQQVYVDFLSRYLAIWAKDNSKMPLMTEALRRNGFSDADIANLKNYVRKTDDGVDRIAPSHIQDNVQLRQMMSEYFIQGMNDAVLMPNVSAQAMSKLGTTSGTPEGVAARFGMKYSVFPIAMSRQIMRRFANGYRGSDALKAQQMSHVVGWVGTSFALAYMATVLKDLAKFKEPINLFDMTAFEFQRLIRQSGTFGFFEYPMNLMTDGPTGILSPLAGTAAEVAGDVFTLDGKGVAEGMSPFSGENLPLVGPIAKHMYANTFAEVLTHSHQDLAESAGE